MGIVYRKRGATPHTSIHVIQESFTLEDYDRDINVVNIAPAVQVNH